MPTHTQASTSISTPANAQASTPANTASATDNKSILVMLTSANDALFLEGLQAALVLASFEHSVQLCLTCDTKKHLYTTQSKAGKMLASLEFYDMAAPWLLYDQEPCTRQETATDQTPSQNPSGYTPIDHINMADFDHVISF